MSLSAKLRSLCVPCLGREEPSQAHKRPPSLQQPIRVLPCCPVTPKHPGTGMEGSHLPPLATCFIRVRVNESSPCPLLPTTLRRQVCVADRWQRRAEEPWNSVSPHSLSQSDFIHSVPRQTEKGGRVHLLLCYC